jgi:hypothetical protein
MILTFKKVFFVFFAGYSVLAALLLIYFLVLELEENVPRNNCREIVYSHFRDQVFL